MISEAVLGRSADTQEDGGDDRVDGRSVANTTYHELRRRILHLDLAPGERLRLEELSQNLGVSLTPVRQALARLESDGFVESIPHRGARVKPLTAAEIELVQCVREGVDGRLACLGASAIDAAGIELLEQHLAQIAVAQQEGDIDGLMFAAWNLRDVIYAAAGRSQLHRIARDWRGHLARYLRAYVGGNKVYLLTYHAELAALVDACRRHDGGTAEQLTRHSIKWTLDALLHGVQETAAATTSSARAPVERE